MGVPFKLEQFETKRIADNWQAPQLDEAGREEIRLEAFEKGYKAGWDDAAEAQSTDADRISADFAHNLNELSFTYHEVRTTILKSLEPLLRQMIDKVLPKMVQGTLGGHVMEQLNELASNGADIPVELVISPENRPALEKLVENAEGLPLEIVDEPSLGSGQVFIRLGETETEIDLDNVISGFAGALDGFFDFNDKDVANG